MKFAQDTGAPTEIILDCDPLLIGKNSNFAKKICFLNIL